MPEESLNLFEILSNKQLISEIYNLTLKVLQCQTAEIRQGKSDENTAA